MSQLHNSHILIGVDSCNFKIALDEMVSIFFVETIITLKLLNGGFRSIGLIGQGVRNDLYGLGLTHQRAAQLVDDQGRAVRMGLCMFCLLNSQGIAGMLYQSMSQALGIAMLNATVTQQAMQQVNVASVSTAVAQILALAPGRPSSGSGSGQSSP